METLVMEWRLTEATESGRVNLLKIYNASSEERAIVPDIEQIRENRPRLQHGLYKENALNRARGPLLNRSTFPAPRPPPPGLAEPGTLGPHPLEKTTSILTTPCEQRLKTLTHDGGSSLEKKNPCSRRATLDVAPLARGARQSGPLLRPGSMPHMTTQHFPAMGAVACRVGICKVPVPWPWRNRSKCIESIQTWFHEYRTVRE